MEDREETSKLQIKNEQNCGKSKGESREKPKKNSGKTEKLNEVGKWTTDGKTKCSLKMQRRPKKMRKM